MDNNELQHWGIRGMKWGIRRYQNKDGTLTNAGKKRYNKEMEKLKEEERVLKNKQKTQAKLDKLEAKRKELDDLKNPKKKTSTDADDENVTTSKKKGQLTKEELQEKVERLTLEARVKELELKLNPPPPEAKKGESFLSKMGSKLAESGLDLGKQYLSKQIEKYFKGEDPLADLKKEAEKARLNKDIETARGMKFKNDQAEKAAKKAAEEQTETSSEPTSNIKPSQNVQTVLSKPSVNQTPTSQTNSDYAKGGKYFVDESWGYLNRDDD